MNWYGLEIDDKMKQIILWRANKEPSIVERGKRLLMTSSGPLIFNMLKVFDDRSKAIVVSSLFQKMKYTDYILLIK